MKQLIDLLRQMGDGAPRSRAPDAAGRQAADALFRGVVAASSVRRDAADVDGVRR